MYLFLSDETNTDTDKTNVQFLIYGAIVIPMENASAAAKEVLKIRESYGYPPYAKFKFDTNSRPKNVSKQKFNEAKGKVLKLAASRDIRFMAYVVHHNVAAKRKHTERAQFGLNTLLCGFDQFLVHENTAGICAIDRFKDDHSVLSNIQTSGVDPVGELGKFQRRLSNIWLYSVTSISCSHLCSVCDIVLGTFRFCVNATDETTVAETLYPKVQELFLHKPNEPAEIEEWGLFFRPKEIRKYGEKYQKLRLHLKNLPHFFL
jgi:hypothetical protein